MDAGLIRVARPADAAAIAAIWNPIIRDTAITFTTSERTEADLAAQLSLLAAENRPALVLEEAGEVRGFALYGPFRTGPGYRFTMEHTVHLAPSARGRGQGRHLMAAMLAQARGAGVRVMVAGVSGENPAGLAFHRALGFGHEVVLPGVGWKFGRPMDLHLLTRDCAPLSPPGRG